MFAYVALVVGAFIIFNTFSITVAQRTRELGLLRTLGASRRQVLSSVIYEGLMLGVVGAVLGLALGLLLAPALNQLFIAFGAELPKNGTVVETRTVIVSLLVGIVVTVAAGIFPAIRATRVPPLAAMREGVTIPPRLLTGPGIVLRGAIGFAIAVGLGALLGGGVFFVLFVVLAIYVTVMLVRLMRGTRPKHYRVIPALGSAIGLLVSWRGITGRLARENSIRQPGRTLVTALALTVGLALVAFISVLAAGTKATINQAVSRSFAGDLIVENSQAGGGQGIPPGVATAVARVPGVASVTPISFTIGRVTDLAKPKAGPLSEKSSITAIEPASFAKVYRVEWEKGSNATLLALGNTGTVLTKSFASANHLKVGQPAVGADALQSTRAPDGRRDRQRQRASARQPHDQSRARAGLLRSARRRRRLRLLRARRRRRAGAGRASTACSPASSRRHARARRRSSRRTRKARSTLC